MNRLDEQLEEQLERMRRLNEQLSEIHRGVAANNEIIARDLARADALRPHTADDRPRRRRQR